MEKPRPQNPEPEHRIHELADEDFDQEILRYSAGNDVSQNQGLSGNAGLSIAKFQVRLHFDRSRK